MKFVSLGYACDAASQIRRLTGQKEAYPFDWLMIPFSALIHSLSSNFFGFLQLENLDKNNREQVFDKTSNTFFLHDFNSSDTINQQFPDVKAKYVRRISRFNDLLSSGQDVTFIRSRQYDDDEKMTVEKAQSLLEVIDQVPGVGRVAVIGVNYEEQSIAPVNLDRASIFTIRKPQPFRWQGDDSGWESVINRLKSARGGCE